MYHKQAHDEQYLVCTSRDFRAFVFVKVNVRQNIKGTRVQWNKVYAYASVCKSACVGVDTELSYAKHFSHCTRYCNMLITLTAAGYTHNLYQFTLWWVC